MMSPYEGERIFEAEMVRLHQCDRSMYACATETRSEAQAKSSVLKWLAARLMWARPKSGAQSLPSSSQTPT